MDETHGMRPLAVRSHEDPHLRPCAQCGSDNGINAARCWRCAAALPPRLDESLEAPQASPFDLDAAAADAWPPNVFVGDGAPAAESERVDERRAPPPEADAGGAGERQPTARPAGDSPHPESRPPQSPEQASKPGTAPAAFAPGDRLRRRPAPVDTGRHDEPDRPSVKRGSGPGETANDAAAAGAASSRTAAAREAAARDALARSQALAERFADRRTSGRGAARRRQALVASVVVVTLGVLIVGYPLYRGMEPLGLALPGLGADVAATARSDAAAPAAAPEAEAPNRGTAQADEHIAAPRPIPSTAPAAPTTRTPPTAATASTAPTISTSTSTSTSPMPTPTAAPDARAQAPGLAGTDPRAGSAATPPAAAPEAAKPGPAAAPPAAPASGAVAPDAAAAPAGARAVPSPAQAVPSPARSGTIATSEEPAAPTASAPTTSAAKPGDVPAPRARLRSLGLAGALEGGTNGAAGTSDPSAAPAAGANPPGASASQAAADPAPSGATPPCSAALAALALCSSTAVEGSP
jgi:hypothetical protein